MRILPRWLTHALNEARAFEESLRRAAALFGDPDDEEKEERERLRRAALDLSAVTPMSPGEALLKIRREEARG